MCLKPQISALLTETSFWKCRWVMCCVWGSCSVYGRQVAALTNKAQRWKAERFLLRFPFFPFMGSQQQITLFHLFLSSLSSSHTTLCVSSYRLCKSPLWIWLGRKKAHESMVQRTTDLTISCHDFLYIYKKTKLFLIVGFVDKKLWSQ